MRFAPNQPCDVSEWATANQGKCAYSSCLSISSSSTFHICFLRSRRCLRALVCQRAAKVVLKTRTLRPGGSVEGALFSARRGHAEAPRRRADRIWGLETAWQGFSADGVHRIGGREYLDGCRRTELMLGLVDLPPARGGSVVACIVSASTQVHSSLRGSEGTLSLFERDARPSFCFVGH